MPLIDCCRAEEIVSESDLSTLEVTEFNKDSMSTTNKIKLGFPFSILRSTNAKADHVPDAILHVPSRAIICVILALTFAFAFADDVGQRSTSRCNITILISYQSDHIQSVIPPFSYFSFFNMITPPNDGMRFSSSWTHESHSFLMDVSPGTGASAPVPFGSQTSACLYVHKNDLLSFEMSMKTVEMCALINGTTPQEAYLQYLAEENEEQMNRQHVRANQDECYEEDPNLLENNAPKKLDFDDEETEDMFIIEL